MAWTCCPTLTSIRYIKVSIQCLLMPLNLHNYHVMFSWTTKPFTTIFVEAFELMLLNFPDLASLSQGIMQAVSCDNRLFELHQEERATSKLPPFLHIKPMVQSHVAPRSPPTSTFDDPMLMEIDRAWAPLTVVKRHYRRTNGLCLYCGTSTHLLHFFPLKNNLRRVYPKNPTSGSQQSENDSVQLQ